MSDLNVSQMLTNIVSHDYTTHPNRTDNLVDFKVINLYRDNFVVYLLNKKTGKERHFDDVTLELAVEKAFNFVNEEWVK